MCVYLVIGLLGVAYPILFQVVAGLDQKYNSTLVQNLFNREREPKFFRWTLIGSVVSMFIWSFKFPSPAGYHNWLIDHSAIGLVVFFTISLLVCFFLFVEKILVYYSIVSFFNYLKKKNEKNEPRDNLDYFNAIADLLYFALKEENISICISISDYFYGKFKQARDQQHGHPVEYHISYKDLIYRSIEQLAQVRNTQFSFLVNYTAGGVWFLGEFESAIIAESTYFAIWRNLLLSIRYARADFVIIYWKWASQHYKSQLMPVRENYSQDDHLENAEEVKERQNERTQFERFHHILAGLMLYQKDFQTLRRMLSYTTSLPPDYVLLPQWMGQVFCWFANFSDRFGENAFRIGTKYPYPDVEGAFDDDIVLTQVRDYVALLFLRQYLIDPPFGYIDPLATPPVPKDYSEKVRWLNCMDLFIKHVERVQQNWDISSEFGLDRINEQFCQQKKVLRPIPYLTQVKQTLQATIQEDLETQPISKDKEAAFKTKTKSIILETLGQYAAITSHGAILKDALTVRLFGKSQILEKSAFADDGDLSERNYDSFLADVISKQFKGGVLYAFTAISSVRYVLEEKYIIPALKRLATDKTYQVISFGLSLRNLAVAYNETVEEFDFQEFDAGLNVQLAESVFVIKKTEVPRFEFKAPTKETIDRLELVELDKSFALYASLIDLNQKNDTFLDLANEPITGMNRTDVLVTIALDCTILFDKTVTCVRIQKSSRNFNRGIVNNLGDIRKP
jgi:hypothetical protein